MIHLNLVLTNEYVPSLKMLGNLTFQLEYDISAIGKLYILVSISKQYNTCPFRCLLHNKGLSQTPL